MVDYTLSKVHGRQYVYYPIVAESLSIESIMIPIDKKSQQSTTIYEKTRNITEGWILSKIMWLIRCRLGWIDNETNEMIEES